LAPVSGYYQRRGKEVTAQPYHRRSGFRVCAHSPWYAVYPSSVPMPRDGWDRAGDLAAVHSTYASYEQRGRGRLWDQRSAGFAKLHADLLSRLIETLRVATRGTTARVLDLGCGAGDLVGVARSAGIEAEWIGLDLRPAVIEEARLSYPDVSFMVGSADEVPLPDASIDVVVTQVLFSSLPSSRLERAVAAEVDRLVAPEGSVVWLDLRYSNPTNPAVHGLSQRRIRALFPSWTVELESAGLLPPVARRLGPLTSVTYAMLAAVRPLRSHLVGRLQRAASSRGV